MKMLYRQFYVVLATLGLLMITSANAQAFDFFSQPCKNGQAKNSAVCNVDPKHDPLTGSDGLIVSIANIIAFVAGVAAVIIIIVAGIQLVTSGGDSQKAKSARSTVLHALIGLVIVVLARTIIYFVVNRL